MARQKARGKRQQAKGKRQEARGNRQEATGKRQQARGFGNLGVWEILHFFTQFGFIVFTYLDKKIYSHTNAKIEYWGVDK
jgi:hypothetical protein